MVDQRAYKQLEKSMYVLCLCLQTCTSGNAWQRNPFIRSAKTKENLHALYEAIETVIVDSITCIALYTKEGLDERIMQRYIQVYEFLFLFHDGIKREEFYHRILTKDQVVMLQFQHLFHQCNYMLSQFDSK